jgi:hypothetical protein
LFCIHYRIYSKETYVLIFFRPALPVPSNPQVVERRRQSLAPSTRPGQRKTAQELWSIARRNPTGGSNNLLNNLRHRISPKTSLPSSNTLDPDPNLSSSSSPNTNSPPISNSIPIKSQQQQQQQQQQTSSSFLDYFSTSFSNKSNPNEQPHQTTKASPSSQSTETIVPLGVVSKKLWISDNEVSICMCCNETQFSMFNRRHHCRCCGRVVCKTCSQQMAIVKNRLVRTCKDCYQSLQNNPTQQTTNSRPEPNNQTKKFENFRP